MIIHFNILSWIIGLKNKIATTYKKSAPLRYRHFSHYLRNTHL